MKLKQVKFEFQDEDDRAIKHAVIFTTEAGPHRFYFKYYKAGKMVKQGAWDNDAKPNKKGAEKIIENYNVPP